METERYVVSFFGLDPQGYTTYTISDIWDVSSRRINEETGISISGEVHDRIYVNPEDIELNRSIIFMIETKKNPNETASEVDYWNAYKKVVDEARKRLGYPRMDLIMEKVNLTHFEKLE
jgi:hypothetical protein